MLSARDGMGRCVKYSSNSFSETEHQYTAVNNLKNRTWLTNGRSSRLAHLRSLVLDMETDRRHLCHCPPQVPTYEY
jgi:hypothetical protein